MPVEWAVKLKIGLILAWQKFFDGTWAAKWFPVILGTARNSCCQGSRRPLGRRICSNGMTSAAVAETLRGTTWKVSVFTMKNGFWKWISHGSKLIAREGYRFTPAEALVYHSIKKLSIWNVLLCCFSKLQMHLQDKIKGNCCLVSLKCPSFWPSQVPHGLSVAMLGNCSWMANYIK